MFGGSFNPPHISHVLACLFALNAFPLDRILVIPNYRHPLDKALLPFSHRLAMTRLAFRHLEPWVEVSTVEEELGGISYTVDTLTELKRRMPGAVFRLIVGSDILVEVERWRRFDEVARLAPLLVVPRMLQPNGGAAGEKARETGEPAGGQAPGQLFLPAVSSTDIRRALAAGLDPGPAVPLAVRDYIRRHRLYQA